MLRPHTSDPGFLTLQQALLGRYSLERELGRGGMGIVYLAHEVALDRPVALKLLPPAQAAQPALRERFLREARTAAKLSHPNIVPIHAVDQVGDFVFFAMAYVDGQTLGERVRTRGPLPSKEAAGVLREVAWALAYAHAEGVIHRDIKPDNILIERGSGRALVTDFGIAHVTRAEGLTTAGEVLGTAEFMSPEQASGEEVGAGSDLYALGVVGYYALSGKLPFEGASMAAVLAKHLTQPAPPVATVAPDVPASLARALDRCLRKSPEERFPDGAALAEELARGVAVQRELPVPLRVFVNRVRGLGEASPMILLLLLVLALVPLLADDPGYLPLVIGWLCLSIGVPFGALALHARRLLAAGYGLEDARLALKQDLERRLEEIRFEYGKGLTWVDRALRIGTWTGFSSLAAALVAGALGIQNGLTDVLGFGGYNLGLLSFFGGAFRNKRRRDLLGSTLRSIFGGRVGEWVFGVGGIALRNSASYSVGGAHRPTEMAIGLAADRLFEELPKALRRELRGLPETVKELEEGARAMRRQVEELGDVLAEIEGEARARAASSEPACGATSRPPARRRAPG